MKFLEKENGQSHWNDRILELETLEDYLPLADFERFLHKLILRDKGGQEIDPLWRIQLDEKQNFVFLDVDGVIYPFYREKIHQQRTRTYAFSELSDEEVIENHFEEYYGSSAYDISATLAFCEKSVDRLISLCQEFDAKIILSSMWGQYRTITQIKRLFGLWGFGDLIVDQTDKKFRGSRCQQIEQWLIVHADKVKGFVALDDDRSDFEKRMPDEFVYCESNPGFSEEKFQLARNCLLKQQNGVHRPEVYHHWSKLSNQESIPCFVFNRETSGQLCRYFGKQHAQMLDELSDRLAKPGVCCPRLTIHDLKQEKDKIVGVCANIIRNNGSIRNLALMKNELENILPITEAMQESDHNIQHINLSENKLDKASLLALKDVVKMRQSPFEVDLRHRDLSIPDELIEAFRENTHAKLHVYGGLGVLSRKMFDRYENVKEADGIHFYPAPERLGVSHLLHNISPGY